MRAIFIIFLIKLTYANAIISDYVMNAAPLSDEEYQQLPKIFHIDNYNECIANPENSFCKITIKLSESKSNNSKMWKIIEKTTTSRKYFNYNELFHAICIQNNTDEVNLKVLAEKYVEKLQLQDLSTNITSIDCNHNDKSILKVRWIDLVFLVCVILYAVVMLKATFSDQSQLSRLTQPFSIKQNWSKMKKMYENVDNNCQLKSIQGLRFYTMVLIVLCHTYLSCSMRFLKNTKYFEDFADNLLKYELIILFVFLVQSFFLISGLLLAWNSFIIFQRDPELSSVRYFCVSAINRYLRLLPSILLEIGLLSTVWCYFFIQGPVKSLYADREFANCKETWWASLIFIQNHYKPNKMCFPVGWYLAADFQLYLLSLIVLIFLRKHQNHLKSILIGIIASGIIGNGLLVYWNNFDIIVRMLPKILNIDGFNIFEVNAIYISTYANLATYMLGISFGIALFKFTEIPFLTSNKHNYALLASFLTIPPFVLFLTSFSYNSIMAGFIAAIAKPLFAFGLGIGIFGISQGLITGLVRRIFEWKPVVFLGNITYGTYVVHYPLVFSRVMLIHHPATVSDTILVVAFIQDLFVSFGCGFLIYFLVEMPFSQLQMLFVPKLEKNVTKNEKNEKFS